MPDDLTAAVERLVANHYSLAECEPPQPHCRRQLDKQIVADSLLPQGPRPVEATLTRKSQKLWTPDWGPEVLEVSVIKGGPRGRYYATEPEARLALQWQLWDRFAEQMKGARGT